MYKQEPFNGDPERDGNHASHRKVSIVLRLGDVHRRTSAHKLLYTATTLFATVASLRSLLLFVPLWVLWSLGFSSVLHTRGSCSISALASKSASRVSSRSRRRCANRSSLSSSEPDCECAARFRSIAVMVSSETASGSVIRGGAGSSK